MKKVAAVILAGGKSTRMGRDKAFLNWSGKSFLKHIIDQVESLNIPIYLSGQQEKLMEFDLPVIEDLIPDQGPVTALASCFDKVKADQILVLSCDVPQIKSTELKRLFAVHKADVTMFSCNGQQLPLVAVYSLSSFDKFIEAHQKGERRLFNVINKMKVKSIIYKGELQNVNSPQDLELIR